MIVMGPFGVWSALSHCGAVEMCGGRGTHEGSSTWEVGNVMHVCDRLLPIVQYYEHSDVFTMVTDF